MPTSDDRLDALIDTSVAVALLVTDHDLHQVVLEAVGRRKVTLSGHARFETFSVLTRLPPPNRRPPATVARLLAVNVPHSRHLSSTGADALAHALGPASISGGAVYDALIASAALEHELPLLTCDRRVEPTYRAVGGRLRAHPLGPDPTPHVRIIGPWYQVRKCRHHRSRTGSTLRTVSARPSATSEPSRD